MSAPRTSGLAGIGAAILFGGASVLWALDQPDASTSSREVLAFYTHTSSRIVAGASLSLVAIPLMVVFASGVRAILREHERDDVTAAAAFGGELPLRASGLAAETINMAAAQLAGEGKLTRGHGRALFESSYVLGLNAAGLGIGLPLLAVAAVALHSHALLPRPLALLAIILGPLFITPI